MTTNWYWSKEAIECKTPSRIDGIDYDSEVKLRNEGVKFLIDIGLSLDLPYPSTIATAAVFFHRFFMIHSFKSFPSYGTACASLFLGAKTEETPKKVGAILKAARELLDEEKYASFGIDPKEEILTLERILLKTLKFDLTVKHPYTYLMKYAKCLKGDKTKLQKTIQSGWTFINDSLCTTLSVQYEPELIAVAVIYLSSKLNQFKIKDWSGRQSWQNYWFEIYVQDLSIAVLEDIGHKILDVYSPPQGLVSPNEKVALKEVPLTTKTTSVNMSQSPLPRTTIIFTTTMSCSTITTNSTPTIVTSLITPKNNFSHDYSHENRDSKPFPWAVLPPSFNLSIKQEKITPDSNMGHPLVGSPYLKLGANRDQTNNLFTRRNKESNWDRKNDGRYFRRYHQNRFQPLRTSRFFRNQEL